MADDRFEPSNAGQAPPPLLRPVPRRTFDTTHNDSADSPTHPFSQAAPPSPIETRRSSDFLSQLNARLLRTYNSRSDDDGDEGEREQGLPSRNKSFLNMTSTLSGIYDEVDSNAASMVETPYGTGAESPSHTGLGFQVRESGVGSLDAGMSMKTRARKGTQARMTEGKRKAQSPKRPRNGAVKLAVFGGKLAALFLFGVIYGLIVSHLHDTRQLTAVHIEGINHENWIYLISWGFFGVALGSLLPYVDVAWGGHDIEEHTEEEESDKDGQSPMSEQINDVVRSVAAFVGIAFAIRRLPWQSTLQLTLTLALVNPALWYILDRSKPGLSCSLIVTSILTSCIFLSNPEVLPSPSLPVMNNATQLPTSKATTGQMKNDFFAGVVSYDNLAVVTWVGSVLFCSCVCFGSIGRRLAVLEESGSKRSG
ncbi:hypothetical protein HBI37_016310 [Parastagonospora nodorum]|nr:hypothetical protein HBH52_042940 [Parastagonospora nodorum]KAH5108863.1 hypothetical protein HBH72_033150 [Parastagonospora nodorum]KAH5511411.1 hypothetical protein HBI31_024630 [Parastagonospora nodorum]KAH6356946.1 hypothetical protein HBI37_016310 [Parastagonospora nodorum]KAH6367957.1 hypothetical protein HBI36_036470 [Parastagonospora nodorum]